MLMLMSALFLELSNALLFHRGIMHVNGVRDLFVPLIEYGWEREKSFRL